MFEEKMNKLSVEELKEAIETIETDINNFADNEMTKEDYIDDFDNFLYDENGDISIGDWSAPAYEVLKETDQYEYNNQFDNWYRDNVDELTYAREDYQNLESEMIIAKEVLEEKTKETPEEKIKRLELENENYVCEIKQLKTDNNVIRAELKNMLDKVSNHFNV